MQLLATTMLMLHLMTVLLQLDALANVVVHADADADGICDDVDDCIGAIDGCGVCNGDGTPARVVRILLQATTTKTTFSLTTVSACTRPRSTWT